MGKTVFSILASLILVLALGISAGIAQQVPICKTQAVVGPAGPDICVSLGVGDLSGQDISPRDLFQAGENIMVLLAMENMGSTDIITKKGFGEEYFHLKLRFIYTAPDGKKQLITATNPLNADEPGPPRTRIINTQFVQIEPVEILPGSPQPWAWTVDPFNAHDFYELDRAGGYSVKAAIGMRTYPKNALLTSAPPVVPLGSADWEDVLVSNTVNFSITDDVDGDGYFYPVASGSHAEVDCDDTDPDVNPGAPETPDNGKDDDCDPNTPDVPTGGSVSVDIRPNRLNLGMGGKWVKGYIELSDCNVATIDLGTVKIGNISVNSGPAKTVNIPAEALSAEVGDYDSDGKADLKLKFPRPALRTAIKDETTEPTVEVAVAVGGVCGGSSFLGTDILNTIKISAIDSAGKRKKKFAGGELAKIKCSFNLPTTCYVKARMDLILKSTGAVLDSVVRGKDLVSGIHTMKFTTTIPNWLQSGDKMKARVKIKRYYSQEGQLIGKETYGLILKIE
jgi:hypothetical protein